METFIRPFMPGIGGLNMADDLQEGDYFIVDDSDPSNRDRLYKLSYYDTERNIHADVLDWKTREKLATAFFLSEKEGLRKVKV